MSMLITQVYGFGGGIDCRYARLPLKKYSSPSKNASTIGMRSDARSAARTRAYSSSAAVPVALSSAPGATSLAGREPAHVVVKLRGIDLREDVGDRPRCGTGCGGRAGRCGRGEGRARRRSTRAT